MLRNPVAQQVALKEIRLFFASPVAWLFLAAFSIISLFSFFWAGAFFARNIADVRPLFEFMPVLLIFLCAALTMRMWSDEKRNGTLEHILTQPAPLWRFALGKFYACLWLLLLALVSTLPLPVTVSLMANLDWGPVVGGYIAASLLGAAYLAIGLYVSARTDNAIVSLIGTVALCGALYLLGSPTLTTFFDDATAQAMRLLGSGARFDSITRGMLDARDLLYYLSLIGAFLYFGIFALERERWARGTANPRHRYWRAGALLLFANLLLANFLLAPVNKLRLDLTADRQFTMSQASQDILGQLREPLLIRGYFSARTHPLLAPLVPQLRDLVREYELAGGERIRVEFIDPANDPAAEEEANKRFGIAPTPFQIADRHESAVVNAYFNLLVSYGDQHQTLGFSDLIEVRTNGNAEPEIQLRNPEYDLTHAIKKVVSSYRMGGNLFDGLAEPVEFIGYVSSDTRLPEPLRAYRQAAAEVLEQAAKASDGRFSYRFIAPEAREGAVARQIKEEWGFKPMVAALGSEQEFYFYLTMADSRQVVQLPTGSFEPESFRLLLDSGLKRFTRGFMRTVALSLPEVDEQMAQYNLGGPVFTHLERSIAQSYTIVLEDLSDGSVPPEADILAVVAPHRLDEAAAFAIDQFLMRGGTVILVTSPFTAELSGGQLQLQDWPSGLDDWLAHHGLQIEQSLVLDKQSTRFPAPVVRQSGDYEFRDVKMLDYPYFVDLRSPGLNSTHSITANLPQVTMAWASPINASGTTDLRVTPLLQSSRNAWRSDDSDIMPRLDAEEEGSFGSAPQGTQLGKQLLGVLAQGRFNSYFSDSDIPLAARDRLARDSRGGTAQLQRPLSRSPESARLILYAANDLMDDQVLANNVTASGTQYLGPVELFMNTLDWALQDDQLLSIRNRAHFNRTLPPMQRSAQQLIEYMNYGLSMLWLLLLAVTAWALRWLRRRRYTRELSL